MAGSSPIEWTDATYNPIGGCSIRSPGCAPCYAQRLAGTRLRNHPLYAGTTDVVKGKSVFNGKLTIAADDHPVWQWPLKWMGAARPLLGEDMPSLIFVGDMSDLFHEKRPYQHIDRVFNVIGATEERHPHIFQLLTKRAGFMARYIRDRGHGAWNARRIGQEAWPARNIWLGFSAERQQEFDARWCEVRQLADQGWIIFVSYEPALGPLVLPGDFLSHGSRVQLIAGGTSGREAEPAYPGWFRAVRDQCAAAGVPFLLKQWGEWSPHYSSHQEKIVVFEDGGTRTGEWYFNATERERAGVELMYRAGKKNSGRLLDGIEHNGFPKVPA